MGSMICPATVVSAEIGEIYRELPDFVERDSYPGGWGAVPGEIGSLVHWHFGAVDRWQRILVRE